MGGGRSLHISKPFFKTRKILAKSGEHEVKDLNVSFLVRSGAPRRAGGSHVHLISWFVKPQCAIPAGLTNAKNGRMGRLVENFLTPDPQRPVINFRVSSLPLVDTAALMFAL